jgi:hypothetical protein
MAAPRPRRRALAAAEEIEYDRVLFFSDAVFAIAQPVLAQYLWLLALLSALVLRRLELPEVDSTITEGDDPHG